MSYYPVFLRVAGRPCRVIGGGEVGTRKALSLLEEGAGVTVIDDQLSPALQSQVKTGRVGHLARPYQQGDLKGVFLAYATTDDKEVQRQIRDEAQKTGTLVNVVDCPDLCSFIVPSVACRGDLTIAVSTSGASPAFARRVRRDIERALGPEYDRALLILTRVRELLHTGDASAAERQRIMIQLADSDLVQLLRTNDTEAVNGLLAHHAGPTFSLQTLGLAV